MIISMLRSRICLILSLYPILWHFEPHFVKGKSAISSIQLNEIPIFEWNSRTAAKRLHLEEESLQRQKRFSSLDGVKPQNHRFRFSLSRKQLSSKQKVGLHPLRFDSSKAYNTTKNINNSNTNNNNLINQTHANDIHQNHRKAEEEPLSLDLLVVTDFSVYKHFLASMAGNDFAAVNLIYQYYTSILQELSKMYSAQRLGFMRFRVYPTGIVITKTLLNSPWIWASKPNATVDDFNYSKPSIDAYETLRNFQMWIKENAESLPQHDHAIAITRFDLERFGDTNAQGIAYVGRICKLGESVSLVEDVGVMATVAIAGHELAHSLGAEHDGQNNTNDCLADYNYLMVPAVATAVDTLPNTFTFSECTIKQIKKHITSPFTDTQCLRHSSLKKLGYSSLNDKSAGSVLLPGQVLDANKQCQHAFGLEFRFCGHNDYYLKQMCRQVWCRNITAGHKSPCYSKPYLPSLTGTSCGNKMWCINGACVEDEEAPSQEGCKFGDRDTGFCMKLVAMEPSACKQEAYSRFCCESCRQFRRSLYRRLRL